MDVEMHRACMPLPKTETYDGPTRSPSHVTPPPPTIHTHHQQYQHQPIHTNNSDLLLGCLAIFGRELFMREAAAQIATLPPAVQEKSYRLMNRTIANLQDKVCAWADMGGWAGEGGYVCVLCRVCDVHTHTHTHAHPHHQQPKTNQTNTQAKPITVQTKPNQTDTPKHKTHKNRWVSSSSPASRGRRRCGSCSRS